MSHISSFRLLLRFSLCLSYCSAQSPRALVQPPSNPVIGQALQVSGPNEPGTVPGTAISYAQPIGSGAAAVTEYKLASWWLTDVQIAGQVFRLAVDTGSADLWVYGSNWSFAQGVSSASPNATPHNNYTCKKSTTSNCSPVGTFNITYTYGFGASGPVLSDTVSISTKSVPNMGVGVASTVGQIGLDTGANTPDGFIGLGFKALSRAGPQQPTFIERLVSRLPAPIFAVDFVPQPGGNSVAQIDFGYVDPNKINGNLYTAPINNSTGSWLVDNVTFVVGDPDPKTPIAPGSIQQSMIFDTGGSSLIDVNPLVAASYYASVQGAYNTTTNTSIIWSFPCNATLPDLTLRIGNGTAVYPASQLKPKTTTGTCPGPIGSWVSLNGGPGNLGAAFFANYFVVFNQAIPQVQYAQSLSARQGANAQQGTTSQQRRARGWMSERVDERAAGGAESTEDDLMRLAEIVN